MVNRNVTIQVRQFILTRVDFDIREPRDKPQLGCAEWKHPSSYSIISATLAIGLVIRECGKGHGAHRLFSRDIHLPNTLLMGQYGARPPPPRLPAAPRRDPLPTSL